MIDENLKVNRRDNETSHLNSLVEDDYGKSRVVPQVLL